MRYFPSILGRSASDDLIDRFERRFDEQGFGLWALQVASTGDFIGFTGVTIRQRGAGVSGFATTVTRAPLAALHTPATGLSASAGERATVVETAKVTGSANDPAS